MATHVLCFTLFKNLQRIHCLESFADRERRVLFFFLYIALMLNVSSWIRSGRQAESQVTSSHQSEAEVTVLNVRQLGTKRSANRSQTAVI